MIKRHRPLAAVVAGLILLGWGMGVLVLHVAHGFFHGEVDRPVSRWIHAHHSHGLNVALFGVAHLGSDAVVLVVALVAGGIWAIRRRRFTPLVALAMAYGGGAIIALAVKVAVRRGQSGLPGGFTGLTELGFPSGHATLGAAVYGTMAVLLARRMDRGRWRSIAVAALVGLALVIGVARVYNGQHDATDVLAGWILGGLWAWAVGTFWLKRDDGSGTPETAAGRGQDASPAPGPHLSVPPKSDGTGAGRRRRRGRRGTRRRLEPAATAAAATTPVAAPVGTVGRVLGRRG